MAAVMKLRKVGGSLGVIIPKEELDRMHLQEGDELFGLPDDGGLHIQARDAELVLKLKAYEICRRKYRNSLHELAR